jgi:hypothetical protein
MNLEVKPGGRTPWSNGLVNSPVMESDNVDGTEQLVEDADAERG